METLVRNIPIEDPFKRTWSEAATIISEEELAQAETGTDKTRSNTTSDSSSRKADISKEQTSEREFVKRLTPSMPDIVIHRDKDIQSQGQCQGQSQGRPEVFRTPQKCYSDLSQRLQSFHSEKHKHSMSVLGDTSDWMLAERSHSRSPPSPALLTRSPDIRSRSPLVNHVSPSVHHMTSPSVFNFSPERTEMYQKEQDVESTRIKKRLFEEMSLGHEIPITRESAQQSYLCGLQSPSNHHREQFHQKRHFMSREVLVPREEVAPEVHFYLDSSSNRSSPTDCHDGERFRAKRRLELDQDYVSTPKRLKTELEREMGIRYLQQLEADMTSLGDKLYTSKPEVKSTNCTCSIMEKQFLAMAESAYRSVRRIDASPRGFEQFRRELILTNQVMKDSIDVLKNIRSFCEHKC